VEVVGSGPSLESLWDQPPDVEVDIILVEASGEHFEEMIDSVNQSQVSSEAAIVILSDRSEPMLVADLLRAGVRALLPGDMSPDQIVAGLEAAAAGLIVLNPAEVGAMFPAAEPASSPLAELIEPLTPRESEVLQMLASGLANKEIATRLAISDHTGEISRGVDPRQARCCEPHRSCHSRNSSRSRSSITSRCGLKTMALDLKTHSLFVPAAGLPRTRIPNSHSLQELAPESWNVLPASGINSHSYPPSWSVIFRTPKLSVFRTSLVGRGAANGRWFLPPVPTTNSRIPRVGSGLPSGSCGANRS